MSANTTKPCNRLPAGISAVSFDLDDTLWTCAPAIANAEAALFKWHERNTPRITENHTPDSLQSHRAAHHRSRPELQGCVTSIRLAGLRKLLSEFGYPEALAEDAFAVFYEARSQVELYGGVLEMLDVLQQSYRLVAITNGNADLQAIGISDYFEQSFAANLTLAAKPAPDMFLRCLKQLDIPPEALLHIGDSPESDIMGGHNAGVQTMWFNQYNALWPGHLPPPHFEVSGLQGIVTLLSLQKDTY